MATRFQLSIAGESADYAAGAADRCFARLDYLENTLSRFIPDSEISRINRLTAGQELILERETWNVLRQAIEVQMWTGGTFDIGVAEHVDIFRAGKQGILNAYEVERALEQTQVTKAAASLYLDPEQPRLYCVQAGMRFDLGGIGKGYALDQLGLLLAEMQIDNYTISAGDSTLLIRGAPNTDRSNWQFAIASAQDRHLLQLTDIAVSASGTFHQGHHIFDPRTGRNSGVSQYERLWVASPIAAYSDALSTGLFLLQPSEITELVDCLAEISWVAYSLEGKLTFVGPENVPLDQQP
ncbi:MAG: FAD:protein FMN transferase [Bacteroidota bacterium]